MSAPPIPGTPPQELSEHEFAEAASRCKHIENQVITGVRAGKAIVWGIAEQLYHFNEEQGWKFLGYESLGEWLAQPEISLTYSTWRRSISNWEASLQHQIPISTLQGDESHPGVDPSKFNIIVPALNSGKASVAEAISDAEIMPASDLREKYVTPKAPREHPDIDGAAVSEPDWADTDDTDGAGVSVSVPESEEAFASQEIIGQPEAPQDGPLDGDSAVAFIEGGDSAVQFMASAGAVEIRDVANVLVQALQRVWDEVAPPERKKMSNDVREVIREALDRARDVGLLDES